MDANSALIGVEELVAAGPESLLVVDCRFDLTHPGQGRLDYLQGHIPGAVHADLDEDLSTRKARKGLGRHPLPSPRRFAHVLGRWGWREGDTVVAYDAGSGAMAAARLWWLMRWMGQPARVLDGGLAAWNEAGLPTGQGETGRDHTRVKVSFDPAQVWGTEQLRDALAQEQIVLLDARAASRYRGEREPVDSLAGHVPGALNRPFTRNLGDDLRWRSAEDLREQFLGLTDGRDPAQVVHMCGSGVTACHNLLAMEHAGLAGSRLYAPSWSGWISHPESPVATGDA